MTLRFIGKKPEVEGVFSFYFEPQESAKWLAGQYLHYELPHSDADERGIGRWFTISTAPFEKKIRITTRFDGERVSSFKQALKELKEGTIVEAGEPRGDFVAEAGVSRHIFIAGGIGITPFRSMIAQLDHEGRTLDIDL